MKDCEQSPTLEFVYVCLDDGHWLRISDFNQEPPLYIRHKGRDYERWQIAGVGKLSAEKVDRLVDNLLPRARAAAAAREKLEE